MWQSKGRSGYGDSTIGGDYDSWDGVSPNGRQYKNEATMETRDLSGADYWHCRKQNRPTEEIPAELHMLKNGKANIDIYGQLDEPKKTVSKVSIKHKILPQFKRLQTLRAQMVDLEKEYKTTDMTCEEYSILRDVIVCKIERAEVLYKKAIAAKPIKTEDEYEEVGENYAYNSCDVDYTDTTIATSSWLDDLSDKNSLKKPMKKALQVAKTLVRYTQATKRYIKTLSEV